MKTKEVSVYMYRLMWMKCGLSIFYFDELGPLIGLSQRCQTCSNSLFDSDPRLCSTPT